jgi:hypothetical protein
MNTKLVAALLGTLGSLAIAQSSIAQSPIQVARFDVDRSNLSSSQRDRVDEIRDNLDDDLSDILSSDEQDELENALNDGEGIDDAVNRLDISDRRRNNVRDILRSAERDLNDVVDSRDRRDVRDRRDLPSIYAPGNWQRPNN